MTGDVGMWDVGTCRPGARRRVLSAVPAFVPVLGGLLRSPNRLLLLGLLLFKCE